MDITSVRYVDGFRLEVTFEDGSTGTADMAETIKGKTFFAPLLDVEIFKQARIEEGTVAWPGDIDIASEAVYALAHGLPKPKSIEDVHANELAVSLRELRKLGNLSQEDVAETLQVSQRSISRLENAAATAQLDTLRRYLSALGWDLEVVAVQGSKRIALRGV